MSAQKHTPGPWLISTPTQVYEVCTIHGLPAQPTEDGCGQTWAYIRPETMTRDGEWHWPDEKEQLANARLIAAAPDLLAALEACLASLERADTTEGVCCCGDSMNAHSNPMDCGHSPVDMGEYYAREAIEAALAAIAKATGAA